VKRKQLVYYKCNSKNRWL